LDRFNFFEVRSDDRRGARLGKSGRKVGGILVYVRLHVSSLIVHIASTNG
jgi:hypothetical protein